MDILFIIGMILFFALTIKKEKKKEATSTNRPQGNVFGDEFPEIKEWSRPEVPKRRESVSEPEPFLREEIKERKPFSYSSQRKSQAPVEPIVINEEGTSEEFRLQDVDEARRAFIFSEIFKRKYD